MYCSYVCPSYKKWNGRHYIILWVVRPPVCTVRALCVSAWMHELMSNLA